jgi:hypothetical protein
METIKNPAEWPGSFDFFPLLYHWWHGREVEK